MDQHEREYDIVKGKKWSLWNNVIWFCSFVYFASLFEKYFS